MLEQTIKVSEKHKKRLREWVKALRSGKYKQFRGGLIRASMKTIAANDPTKARFCCLGVAQVIAGTLLKDIHGGLLNYAAMHYFGLGYSDPVIAFCNEEEEDEKISAARANDDFKWPFAKIANAIERTYALKPNKAKKGKK